MIIIRLSGGLGNQIFQFGAGLLLAKKSGIVKIILDDSALGKYKIKRNNNLLFFFDLLKFNFEVKFDNILITSARIPKLLPVKFSKYPFVNDRNFQSALKNPNKYFMILDGYFQGCLTQENFNDEVKIFKNIFIPNKLEKKDGCVVHIRGGDFVKLGWSSITPKEYYLNAMEKMINKVRAGTIDLIKVGKAS